MMGAHRLIDAITSIRDDLVEGAAQPCVCSRPRLKRGALAAAVLAVCLSGAGIGIRFWGWGPGGASSGGAGHGGGSTFMSYAGPAFPLTVLDGNESPSAERHITYDFSARDGSPSAALQDDYVLSNYGDQDITVTLAYPYASSFSELKRPRLFVDGKETPSALSAGPYSGGFASAVGSGSADGSINLDQLDSWEGYKSLLESGDYLQAVLTAVPSLDIPVIVYKLTDVSADDHETYASPTLEMSFTIDPEKTSILTYGFNGGSWNDKTGFTTRNFSVPREGENGYSSAVYLIVAGQDLDGYTLEGYPDGGCEPGEEIEGVAASVTRYESTLDEVLLALTQAFETVYGGPAEGYDEVPFELYFQEIRRLFAQYGPLGDSPAERYTMGMLEDIISEAKHCRRVLYETVDVSIPAGGSITVSISAVKPASFDFACTGADNAGVYGYDMVTQLGSSLAFEAVTASLAGYDGIEIVRQNFGFDLAANVDTVSLDPAQEHYYLEIRRTE